MLRQNFEAVTNLIALKKNAILMCGQEFIAELNRQGLHAKDDGFWQAVNSRLNISADAYIVRQKQERVERERQERERIELENSELQRLLNNKKEVSRSTRNDWQIVIYELPNSNIFGNKFMATLSKASTQTQENTNFCDTSRQAHSSACNLADERDRQERRELEFQNRYRVLKPLYLVAIYLFSWDEFRGCFEKRAPRDSEERRQFYLEYFNGVGSFNGFDFDITNRLEAEGLLEFSTSKKTLNITKTAVRQAIAAAQQMNIPGMEELLSDKAIHLECLDYQNYWERMQAEFKDDRLADENQDNNTPRALQAEDPMDR
jgi:hypothetical protein